MEFPNDIVRWVGRVGYEEFREVLKDIDRILKTNKEVDDQLTDPITLMITSEGGFLPLAFHFAEEMRIRGIDLDSVAIGRVDSAAVVILLCGQDRYITKNSHIYLHPLKFHKDEDSVKKENMRKWYKEMVAKNTKLTVEEVSGLMQEEKLLEPEEAKEKGFVQEVL